MDKRKIETAVGIFLVLGLLSLAYLSIKLGDVELFGSDGYIVKARFSNISGLKEGTTVEIAGVQVGRVSGIKLNDYEAIVELLIEPSVHLHDDSIASIRTMGIIGDKYVKITPGGSSGYISAGGEILETESAIELEELVSKYIFKE